MTTLITNKQFKQFDENGLPLAAGKIYTYEVGTTTNKTTYQDEAKVAAHTNPIILDAWGEATIWIDGDTKFVVKDSDDATIRTYPSFADSDEEFPVISSPLGAVYRSTSTDVGYLKIKLPMSEWPNTKMMFDVMIYTDEGDEAFILTLGGYADSNTSSWLTTTAITNGITEYTVQFGNDGANPAIYIGTVSTSWVKPQIAIVNFLSGQFSYDWDTWSSGWDISVTTTLGTITSTKTADGASVSPWIEVSDYETGFSGLAGEKLSCRTVNNGKTVEITGAIGNVGVATGNLDVCTLPSGYRPLRKFQANIGRSAGDFATTGGLAAMYILTDGTINVAIGTNPTWNIYITLSFPLE